MSMHTFPTAVNTAQSGRPHGHKRSHGLNASQTQSVLFSVSSSSASESPNHGATDALYPVDAAPFQSPPSVNGTRYATGAGDQIRPVNDAQFDALRAASEAYMKHDCGDQEVLRPKLVVTNDTCQLFSPNEADLFDIGFFPREILLTSLLPLLYTIVSLLVPSSSSSDQLPYQDEIVDEIEHVTAPARRTILKTCILVSATLLFIGFYGIIRGTTLTRNQKIQHVAGIDVTRFLPFLKSVLSIGLPYYAALQVQNGRIAIVMLTVLAYGRSSPVKTNRQIASYEYFMSLLKRRKNITALVVFMLLLDVAGPTSIFVDFWQTVKGYLALLFSVLLFPPLFNNGDFAPAYDGDIDSSTGFTNFEGPETTTRPSIAQNYFVQGGAALGVITLFAFLFTDGLYITFFGTLTVLGVSGLSLLLSILGSFVPRAPSLAALAIGFGSSLLTTAVISSTGYLELLVHALLSVAAYLSVWFDKKVASRGHHNHHHHHHHNHHHHKKETSHSAFTGRLLAACESWPFVYGILREKDSRRIFYFMRYDYPHSTMILAVSNDFIQSQLWIYDDSDGIRYYYWVLGPSQ